MSEVALQAVPLSIDTIRGLAAEVRDALGYGQTALVPGQRLIEFDLPKLLPSFVYDIGTKQGMGSNLGLASPDYDYIQIREDVYEGLRRHNGRDRFTLAHEIGHLVLHTKENVVMRRGTRPPARFCQPEWQANTFAAEFLMDLRMIGRDDDELTLTRRFGVSMGAAKTRMDLLRRTGALQTKTDRSLIGPVK